MDDIYSKEICDLKHTAEAERYEEVKKTLKLHDEKMEAIRTSLNGKFTRLTNLLLVLLGGVIANLLVIIFKK